MASEHNPHRIIVCTLCRHTGNPCQPGAALIAKLNDVLLKAEPALGPSFVVEGTACMAGCSRPCTVAFSASQKMSYLFGDIANDDDIAALVSFARLYLERSDGKSNSIERPPQLRGKTLARIPATLIATKPLEGALQ